MQYVCKESTIENMEALEISTVQIGNYFETHIAEAKEVNTIRMGKYALITDGQSLKLSKTFIRNQWLSLPIARFTDRLGRKFQKAGIPILELDLVSMDLIDDFSTKSEVEPQNLSEFIPLDVRAIRKKLKKAFNQNGFRGVSIQAQREINKISKIHTYHGMCRHMLESIVRMANLADIYIEMAERKNVKSPARLSRFLLTLHMNALTGCKKLDIIAAPIQAQGIPIIHQDVPPIPPLPAGIDVYL